MVGQGIIQCQRSIALGRHFPVIGQTVGMYGYILSGHPMLSGTDHDITMGRNGELTGFRCQAAVGIVKGGIAGLMGIFGNQQIMTGKHSSMIGQIVSQQAGIVVG
ncbi:hypothetical protein VSP9026_03807 [Vibrio spartinae]|uniref:Uncharacterized protein n=1 Tax=Vibrio spartinae TaxID=1918945 RepID=A0A1N6M9H8_9VIBR|nr:hypothetical protein VSP9026_03807 [Vibrio spartinae]